SPNTTIASISLKKDVYCIQDDSIRNILVTGAEIKQASEYDSVIRKARKFMKVKWPFSSLKGDFLDLFHRVRSCQ
ncbi:unnamed protein product, partial [Hymenolepis diminuta]